MRAIIESLLIVLSKRHLQCFHIQRSRRDCVVANLGDDTQCCDAGSEACIQIVGAGTWNYFIALGDHEQRRHLIEGAYRQDSYLSWISHFTGTSETARAAELGDARIGR